MSMSSAGISRSTLDGGQQEFAFGSFGYFRIPGVWLELAFALACSVAAAFTLVRIREEQPRTDGADVLFWVLAGVSLFMLLAELCAWMHSRTVRIRSDATGICYTSAWKHWHMAWEDICGYELSPAGIVLARRDDETGKVTRRALPVFIPGAETLFGYLLDNEVRELQYYTEQPGAPLLWMPYTSAGPTFRLIAGAALSVALIATLHVALGLSQPVLNGLVSLFLVIFLWAVADSRKWVAIDNASARVKRRWRREVVIDRAAIENAGVFLETQWTAPPYGRYREAYLRLRCRDGSVYDVRESHVEWKPVYYHLTRDTRFRSRLVEEGAAGRKGAQLRELERTYFAAADRNHA